MAIIATDKSYKDALSVSPIAYAKGYPILLAKDGTTLTKDVMNALKSLGIKQVIIVGGKAAVTTNVENQLRQAGIGIKKRLYGKTAVDTSAAIAKWGISNGLKANNMGVATSNAFPDALSGAALCGRRGSVLVLADDTHQLNWTFPGNYKASIKTAFVFGGPKAVGDATWSALVLSTS